MVSVAKGEAAVPDEVEGADQFAGLLSWMGEVLADEVREVRLTSRLTTSPACLVGDSTDMTPTLEKMYRAMGQDMPTIKRILELNAAHPLVVALRTAHEQHPDDEGAADTARLLHGMALLAEGGDLTDPAAFVGLLADRLQRSL